MDKDYFQEGMDDYLDGIDSNPYPLGSAEALQWQTGWEAAADGAWDAWKSGE